jgi:hypothetical protein
MEWWIFEFKYARKEKKLGIEVEQVSRNQDMIRLRPVNHFLIDTESSQFLQPSILHQASENKGNKQLSFWYCL